MADEATNVVLLGNQGDPVEYVILVGAAVAKGTVMQISSSPQTITAGASGGIMAGILAEEKTATDGKTHVACLTHCIADLTCGAGETMGYGEPVHMGAVANEVDLATADTIEDTALVVGLALNDVAGNASGPVLINVGKRR